VPTIQYGGYFLLTSLVNRGSGYVENPLRHNFFRAGHAHAGVIVILSLVCHAEELQRFVAVSLAKMGGKQTQQACKAVLVS
jgi:hypothetical protein